jgi:cyanoexosortase A
MDDKKAIAIAVGSLLLISYLSALLRFHDNAHLGMSALFGLAVFDVAYRFHKGHVLRFQQPACWLGGLLVGWLVILNFKYTNFYLIRVSPFWGGLGFVLLFFGFNGLKKYWRELLLLFVLGVPSAIAVFLPDPSPLAARFAAAVLHLMNWNIQIDGWALVTETTKVSVFRGCSGLEYMTYLLGISTAFLLVFPVSGMKAYLTPIVGILLGFITNGMRVVLLTLLAIAGDDYGFVYWHEGQGSLLFGAVAVILFGLYYWLLIGAEMRAKAPLRS